jgi:nicotinate-nucleotide pyrophosphorylase (carboxylating)
MNLLIDNIIKEALKEDIRTGDITTNILIDEKKLAKAFIRCKEEIVLAGINVASRVFNLIDDTIIFKALAKDGDLLQPYSTIAEIKGKAKNLLTAERTALNFLQHLSGIATQTYKLSCIAQKYSVKITDTRKTIPNLRYLQKYAVSIGGGKNHRFALDDGILIKNNHLKFFKSISEAIKKAQLSKPYLIEIEIEVSSIEELIEALKYNPDVIMLDNFSYKDLKKAISIAKGKCKIEVSGGITKENFEKIASLKPDFISIGSLTHSVKAVDIHMEIEPI